MIRPPYLARVAVGAAVYALEETRKLPSTAVTLPMTAFSQMLQTTMHFQQFVTSLAIKGDRVLGDLYDDAEEQPAWATFDDDAEQTETRERPATPGRFALYSMPQSAAATQAATTRQTATKPAATKTTTAKTTTAKPSAAKPAVAKAANPTPEAASSTPAPAAKNAAAAVPEPEIVQYLDYTALTLAQLRARLRSLNVDELTELLHFEEATRARAPFQTMLTNRIAAQAKK